MDVRLPNGQVVQNVPDGTSKADLMAQLDANNIDYSTPQFQDQEPPKDDLPFVPDSVERGLARAGYGVDFALHGLGVKSDEDFAQDTANLAKRLNELKMSEKAEEGLQEIYDSEGVGDFFMNLATNPRAVGNILGESVGAIAGAGAFAVGGSKVAAAKAVPIWGQRLLSAGIFGAGSGGVEAGSSFFTDLAEMGEVDISDPEAVQDTLQDTELVSEMRKRAAQRGVPIAAFDALTMGIAGMPFKALKGPSPTMASVGRGAAAELGIQAAGGAAGEAGAQLLAEGAITDPVSVGLEAALEFITGGPQAAIQTMTVDGIQNPIGESLREALVSTKVRDALGETPMAETDVGPVPVKEKGKKKTKVAEAIADAPMTELPPTSEILGAMTPSTVEAGTPAGTGVVTPTTEAPANILGGMTPSTPLPKNAPQDLRMDSKINKQVFANNRQDAQGFYSQLEKVVDEKFPNKGTKASYKELLDTFQRKGLFKAEELEFSGLPELLDGDKLPITKMEVMAFLDSKEGGTALSDNILVTEGNQDFKGVNDTHWDRVTLEGERGSKNYRENLITLDSPQLSDDELYEGKDGYFNDHWPDWMNVIAHYRMSDKAVNGTNSLFIEELQSDWHQEGRKYGYKKAGETLEGDTATLWERLTEPHTKETITDREKFEDFFTGERTEYSIIPNVVDFAIERLDNPDGGSYGYNAFRYIPKASSMLSKQDIKEITDKLRSLISKTGALEVGQDDFARRLLHEVEGDPIHDTLIASGLDLTHIIDNLINGLPLREAVEKAADTQKIIERYDAATLDELKVKIIQDRDSQGAFEDFNAKVPEAPFKKNWHELVLKRILKQAVSEGYDSITVPKGVTAQRIQGHSDNRTHKFYDEILPSALKKLSKKYKFTISDGNLETDKLLVGEGNATGLVPAEGYREEVAGPGVPYTPEVTVITLTPESKEIIGAYKQGQGFPRFQRTQAPVQEATVTEDFKPISPDERFRTDNSEVLKAVELSPQMEKVNKKLIQKLKNISRAISGPFIDPRIVSKVGVMDSATNTLELLQGAQWTNMAITALSAKNPTETTYHENWHFLKMFGMFDAPEVKAALARGLPKYKKYIVENSAINEAEYEAFMGTEEGIEEIEATLFGMLAAKWDAGDKVGFTGVPSEIMKIFKKAWEAIKSIYKTIRGADIEIEDIFMDTIAGKNAVTDIIYNERMARVKRQAAARQVANQENVYDVDSHKEDFKEAVETQNALGQTFALIRKGKALVSSPAGLARQSDNPVISKVYTALDKIRTEEHSIYQELQRAFEGYFALPKETRYALMVLADEMKRTKQKATLDEVGRLNFVRDGRQIRIDNIEASRQYMKIQEGFALTLDKYEDTYRRGIRKVFRSLGSDFTIKDLNALRKTKLKKGQKEKLDVMITELKNFKNLKNSDYVPGMRFGKWGFAVHEIGVDEKGDKKKELVDFVMIDAGFGKDKYHPTQLAEARERLKRKYSDPKYIISGSKETKGRNVSALEPFHANRNTIANEVDGSLLTLDMVAGLLHSKDMDAKDYAAVRDELLADITEGEFKKKFSKSKDIPGYSKDWDRVIRAYTQGASTFISKLDNQAYLSNIASNLNSIEDEGIKQQAQDLIRYVQDPAEDLQKLRAFNFFWALGFNTSSAALQYMALPSITLGQMSQYGGSVIGNMGRISNWVSIGGAFMGTKGGKQWTDSGFSINFDSEDAWAKIRKMKRTQHLSDDQFNDLKELTISQWKKGNLGAMLVQEFGGTTISGQKTGAERAKMAVQTSGVMISAAEQLTRFATLMATADLLATDASALETADRVLSVEPVYNDRKKLNPDDSTLESAAEQTLHKSHAVFGKLGRAGMFKSIGGALIFPFQTWTAQMWGLLAQMQKANTPESRRGLIVTLGSMMLLSGMVGLPGAELLKELYEALHKQFAGEEIDLDDIITRSINNSTGAKGLGTFVTHGALRQLGGIEVSKRTGLSVPGQEIALTLMGTKKDPTALIGMEGSIISGVGRAFESMNTDAGAAAVLQDVLPVALANVAKAVRFSQEGVRTRGGKSQVISEADITPKMIAMRIFGVTEGKIAEAREQQFYAQTLERQHKPAYDRFKRRMENHLTKYYVQAKKGNDDYAQKHFKEYHKVAEELNKWSIKTGYLVPYSSMFRSLNDKVYQRLNTEINVKNYNKNSRQAINKMVEDYK
jgi:hypothetical protein